jgi:hypothetical protein
VEPDAEHRLEIAVPPLAEKKFFLDALRERDVDDVQRAFAPTLERALLEKARSLARSGAVTSTGRQDIEPVVRPLVGAQKEEAVRSRSAISFVTSSPGTCP